ncbi:hypothetical protein M2163_000900 [Streptomyces sp. SAI-135]|jgi:hypothetical protein|uniref:hypothetical protein n=1 Tax=unclassified Streptomyces TaxID=2593676 RepID=UPI0024767B84|nr:MULTISPECIES: hypothetical protein [unclassified Streptomyces]MDH6522590.1 hypothetical protein [Streptomyces sp. SAI-090]MDH6554213.1 hypothetical protein [Streptomyces sp. SAI-041]MDH6581789.1 hypothetical protein [Streptomyces sp. SAI-133]MDH6613792.1 hypothetical protein [Streptomyces sp. SAI-135]
MDSFGRVHLAGEGPAWSLERQLQAIVQAAVSGLLVQLGYTVTEPSDSGDLLVFG